MWYDDPFVKFKKRHRNRRRRGRRDPILMVNARMMEQRRDRLQKIGVLVLCLAALGGLAWLSLQGGRLLGRALFTQNRLYTIARFELGSDGNRIPARLIREYAELDDGMNLFAVNLQTVRARLEGVPLVQRVQVQRILPDTLKVWVTERVAIARLGPEEHAYPLAIDRHGYVLGPSARHANLPHITGIDMASLRRGKQTEELQLLDALQVLDLCHMDRALSRVLHIQRIDVADPNALELTLDGSRKARVSRTETDARLRDLAVTVQHADRTGANWTNFNFTVPKNPAVQ